MFQSQLHIFFDLLPNYNILLQQVILVIIFIIFIYTSILYYVLLSSHPKMKIYRIKHIAYDNKDTLPNGRYIIFLDLYKLRKQKQIK